MREKALDEMATELETTVMEIKSKWLNLRSQLGRENTKVKRTKSGQATDELYKPNWPYWQHLQFLQPAMQPVRGRDNLQKSADSPESSPALGELSSCSSKDEQHESNSCIPKKQRKKAAELKRDEVLSQCLNVLKEPEKEEKKSPFASYVAEKLEMFSPRNRAIAEKKITDVLFAIEMGMLEPMAPINVSDHTTPQHAYIPGHNNQQTFMSMLQ
eukprot:Seg10928.2 transcript_id=Seg10928.2/GoldUCD/mRNA.D3Y31 product="hypothetical protein" protein_id=Seg10928.2/GoldUCD/D3Y31